VPSEVVLAVAIEILLGLLGHVEHVALAHQLMRLLVGIRERLGDGSAAAVEEAFVDLPAEVLPADIGNFGDRIRPACVLRRVAVAEVDAGVLRPKIGRLVAAPAGAARRDEDVPRQWAVGRCKRLRGHSADLRIIGGRRLPAAGEH
jgi:hypothetical protein